MKKSFSIIILILIAICVINSTCTVNYVLHIANKNVNSITRVEVGSSSCPSSPAMTTNYLPGPITTGNFSTLNVSFEKGTTTLFCVYSATLIGQMSVYWDGGYTYVYEADGTFRRTDLSAILK